MRNPFAFTALAGASIALTFAADAYAQTDLPQITVETVKQKPKPKRTAVRRTPAPPAPAQTQQATQTPAEAARQAVEAVTDKNAQFDQTRANILAPIGASNYQVSHAAIEAMPQGGNASFDKVLLQVPGVSQDTAVNGAIHI